MKKFLLLLFIGITFVGCGSKKTGYRSYSIGRDPTWFPLQLNQKVININALTNALIQEIAKEEEILLSLENIDWLQLFQSLDNGEVAGILSSLPPNVITLDKYAFSDPFVLLGPVLVVPKESKAKSLKDLEGKIVAAYQYDDSVLIVQKYPSIIIQLYQNMPLALEELAAGNYDGLLMPTLDAHNLVPTVYPDTLKIVSAPLNNKGLRLVTLHDAHHSLRKYFNNGLKRLRSSSKYTALRKEYGLN